MHLDQKSRQTAANARESLSARELPKRAEAMAYSILFDDSVLVVVRAYSLSHARALAYSARAKEPQPHPKIVEVQSKPIIDNAEVVETTFGHPALRK